MLTPREVLEAPKSAVEAGICQMGTFNTPIRNLNLLQARNPLGIDTPKPFNYMRLKEWQAFQFDNEQWFMCLAVYNTKSLGTAIIMAYSKQDQKMYRYEHKVPFWKLKVPSGLQNSECYYQHKDLSIHIHNHLDKDVISVKFHAKNFKNCPDIAGQINAHTVTEPIVIVQPFANNRPLYSHKALMPAESSISVNNVITHTRLDQGCMIVDDHKGFYPIKMQYDWVTALGYDKQGTLQGFNLTDNQIENHFKYNENCLWHKGKMHPLPPIKVERPNGVDKPWRIRDTYGQVDLTFTPLADVPLKIGIGIKLVDYHGPTGEASGFIKTNVGEKVVFEKFMGMGERKLIRM